MTKEEVNCIHLAPPLVKVPRWHCYMDDGRKGDCFMLLNKATRCSFREEKMITKTTAYKQEDTDDDWVLEFPELEVINLGDPDIQKQLIKWGFAVGIPGGEFVMRKSVRMVAGGAK